MVKEPTRDFSLLPEELISLVLSYTTPRDVCVASAVSSSFQTAAEFDASWHKFLFFPDRHIHFGAPQNISSKEICLHLMHHPMLIAGGLMRMGFDRLTGATLYMVSARKLIFKFSNHPRYWEWVADQHSRFMECAKPRIMVHGTLDIRGTMDLELLTPNTVYAAFFIYKLGANRRIPGDPLEKSTIRINGGVVSEHTVFMDMGVFPKSQAPGVKLPVRREDGWVELELGSFNTGNRIQGAVEVHFLEQRSRNKMIALILEGLEFRPRHH